MPRTTVPLVDAASILVISLTSACLWHQLRELVDASALMECDQMPQGWQNVGLRHVGVSSALGVLTTTVGNLATGHFVIGHHEVTAVVGGIQAAGIVAQNVQTTCSDVDHSVRHYSLF